MSLDPHHRGQSLPENRDSKEFQELFRTASKPLEIHTEDIPEHFVLKLSLWILLSASLLFAQMRK